MMTSCWCGARVRQPRGFIRFRAAASNSAKRCTRRCIARSTRKPPCKSTSSALPDGARWCREPRGAHYLILSFAARWISGEPVLNDELDDFRWLKPDAIDDLQVTAGLPEIIQSAWRLVRA